MSYFPCNESADVIIDGEKVSLKKLEYINCGVKVVNKPLPPLPYAFALGSAVVLNGEIHILGGASSGTSHYKWDGSTWTQVSTLPYNFVYGSAVVLNGEIHILGGNDSNKTSHYKWDGSTWTQVSTLPYEFTYSGGGWNYHGSAVVLNGEIHILSGGRTSIGGTSYGNNNHYKWDGSTWTKVSTLPYYTTIPLVSVLNDEIHIFITYVYVNGSSSAPDHRHYKWNGSAWVQLLDPPIIVNNSPGNESSMITLHNAIYQLGWNYSSNKDNYLNLEFIDNIWKQLEDTLEHYGNQRVVVNNDAIYMLGGGGGSTGKSLQDKFFVVSISDYALRFAK